MVLFWIFVLLISPSTSIADLLYGVPTGLTVYDYRGTFGTSETYLIAHYDILNNGDEPKWNHIKWSIVTSTGTQFDDGYHPLVQASYCRQSAHCTEKPMTALDVTKNIMPGGTVQALSIFGPITNDKPRTVRLIGSSWRGAGFKSNCEIGGAGLGYTCVKEVSTGLQDEQKKKKPDKKSGH